MWLYGLLPPVIFLLVAEWRSGILFVGLSFFLFRCTSPLGLACCDGGREGSLTKSANDLAHFEDGCKLDAHIYII